MLTLSGSQIVKLIKSRYDHIMCGHRNYIRSDKIVSDHGEITINELSDFTNAVLQTILKYCYYHVDYGDSKNITLDFDPCDGSAIVTCLSGSTWGDIKAEMLIAT
jgi:hypothetical protein